MSLLQTDRRVTVAAGFALFLVVMMALVYAFSGLLGETVVTWAIDLGDVLAVATCVVLCLVLWFSSEEGESLRNVWAFLGVGLAMWTAAQAIFAVYELFPAQGAEAVSMADALWIPGYVPIFVALWLRYRLLQVPLTANQWVGLVVGFVVLAGLSSAFVIAPSVMAMGVPQSGTESAYGIGDLSLGVLYLIGDLLVAMGAGLMILALTGGTFSRSWILIALGCLAIGLADSMYYAGLANGLYAFQVPINLFTAISDLSFFVGYLMIMLGLFAQARLQRAL